MNRTRLRWMALLALPLCATACAKPAAEGATKSGEGPASGAHAEAFGKLTVDELEAKMKDAKAGKVALYIYDNNQKGRFDKGHIPGAKWLQADAVKASDLPPDKEAVLVFYCASEA